jgi:hypothetical protein
MPLLPAIDHLPQPRSKGEVEETVRQEMRTQGIVYHIHFPIDTYVIHL